MTIRNCRIHFALGPGLAIAAIFIQSVVYSQEPATPTFGTTVVVPFGLRGLIYFLPPRTGKLPAFPALDPVGAIYTSTLNVTPRSFKEGFPGVTDRFVWFALDYTGRFWIEEPGAYQFALTSDDGAKLYIDGQLAVDNDGVHSPRIRKGDMRLSGGIHRIRVSYFQGPPISIALVLTLTGPNGRRQVFSTDRFKPPADPEKWKYGKPADLGDDPSLELNFQPTEKARKAYVEGLSALAGGNWNDARKRLEHAARISPDYAQAWSALGLAWERQDNVAKAVKAYEKSLSADPAYIIAAVRLVHIKVVQNRDEEALVVATRAIAAHPTGNPLIFFFEAVANVHLKQLDAAEKNTRHAIELDMARDVPRAESLLGIILAGKGDTPGALEHLKKYLELAPDAGDSGEVRARIAALEQSAPAQ